MTRIPRSLAIVALLSSLHCLAAPVSMAQTANRSPANEGGGQQLGPGLVNRSAPSTREPGVNGTSPIDPQIGPPVADDRRLDRQDERDTQICKGC